MLTGLGLKPAPWDELWATNRLTYGTAMLVERWDVLEKYLYNGMYWRSICTMGCTGEVSVRWDVLEKYQYDGMYWRSICTMGCIGEVSVRWDLLEKYLYLGKRKRKGMFKIAHNLCFSTILG